MDEIEIEYQDVQNKVKDVIVGIYNGILSRSGKYGALLGMDIITWKSREGHCLLCRGWSWPSRNKNQKYFAFCVVGAGLVSAKNE